MTRGVLVNGDRRRVETVVDETGGLVGPLPGNIPDDLRQAPQLSPQHFNAILLRAFLSSAGAFDRRRRRSGPD
jgi:hypothetical protein